MTERIPALIFTLRGQDYGLVHDADAVLLPWLQRYQEPGPVPGVPGWLLGLLNVQGTVQAIVDLGAFLGFGASTPADASRLVFLEGHGCCVGLLVDGASGMRALDAAVEHDHDHAHPLITGRATVSSTPVHILNGSGLIQSLARALDGHAVGKA